MREASAHQSTTESANGRQECRTQPDGGDADERRRDAIIEWYRSKTGSLLAKYGPGPRIHFHVGIPAGPLIGDPLDLSACRRALVASQEALLHHAADIWEAKPRLSGDVLDVGCGLGGGSIFWAQEYGAKVTAITIVQEHAALTTELAKKAGVDDRVTALVVDACAIKSRVAFDAAVAIESVCYLPRRAWFKHVSGLLREDAIICVEDSFVVDQRWAEPFDKYWRTTVGTQDEYEAAALEAGFKLDRDVDITSQAKEFWGQSLVYNDLLRRESLPGSEEWGRLGRSLEWHSGCLRAWDERGIVTKILRFRR